MRHRAPRGRARLFLPIALLAAAGVAGVAAPRVASGAPPRYGRRAPVLEVKATAATRPPAAPAAPGRQTPAPGPSLDADAILGIEAAVADIRTQLIEELRALIRDTPPDDPELPDLLFRLAEALAAKQRFHHFVAMEELGRAEAATEAGARARHRARHRAAVAEERRWLAAAVAAYQALAGEPRFRGYARMEEALFYYAWTLARAGRPELARAVYRRLLREHPGSRFAPDAYLAFAEWYFRSNDLENAARFLDKVLEFPRASVYPHALYLKGWVLYNQGRPQGALEAWFRVTELTRAQPRQEALARAARKDFVRAYADVGRPDRAVPAFRRVDREAAQGMLVTLGELYLAQGKTDATIAVHRQLLALDAEDGVTDRRACGWQAAVVRATLSRGGTEDKVKEVRRLLRFWRHLREGGGVPASSLAECREDAEATTSELAKLWHADALRLASAPLLDDAARLYRLFLEFFPDSPRAPELAYWLAEATWERAAREPVAALAPARWEEAADAFQRAAEGGGLDRDLVAESACAAAYARMNGAAAAGPEAAPIAPPAEGAAVAPGPPAPLPPREARLLEALDLCLARGGDPGDDRPIAMRFQKGRTLWKHGHHEEALPILAAIVERHPTHEAALYSARLLADCLVRLGREAELVRRVDSMLASPALLQGRPELAEELGRLRRVWESRIADRAAAAGRHRECGERYLELFNRTLALAPDGAGAEADLARMLQSAGVCFERAGLLGQAIQMREELTRRFPERPEAQHAGYALGFNYAQIAGPYYVRAAERFEAFARRFPDEPAAIAAIKDAYFFRKGLGHDREAIADIEFLLGHGRLAARHPAEAAAAAYALADVHEHRGDAAATARALEAYLGRWAGHGGVDRRIAAHVRLGQLRWRASCPVAGDGGACVEVRRERALKTAPGRRGRAATQCGPAWKTRVLVIPRRSAPAREARRHFEAALALWADGRARGEAGGADEAERQARGAAMAHWAGAAAFHLAEEAYERALAVRFPPGLVFDERRPREARESARRFAAWLAAKTEATVTAKARFAAVVELARGGGGAAAGWAIASAARAGQLYQSYADALYTAPIPPLPEAIRRLARATGESIADVEQQFEDEYCGRLEREAAPLEEAAVAAFAACLDTAAALGAASEWSRRCERELGQLRPREFASAGELRAPSDRVPVTLDVAPIVAGLDGAR